MRRQLYWTLALSDLRADRAAPPSIREELLQHHSTPAARLSAWRGRSGRRYVVMVYPLTDAPIALDGVADPALIVALAVRRDAPFARIVGVGSLAWIERRQLALVLDGATELHVYRLAETSIECSDMIEDLQAPCGLEGACAPSRQAGR